MHLCVWYRFLLQIFLRNFKIVLRTSLLIVGTCYAQDDISSAPLSDSWTTAKDAKVEAETTSPIERVWCVAHRYSEIDRYGT